MEGIIQQRINQNLSSCISCDFGFILRRGAWSYGSQQPLIHSLTAYFTISVWKLLIYLVILTVVSYSILASPFSCLLITCPVDIAFYTSAYGSNSQALGCHLHLASRCLRSFIHNTVYTVSTAYMKTLNPYCFAFYPSTLIFTFLSSLISNFLAWTSYAFDFFQNQKKRMSIFFFCC